MNTQTSLINIKRRWLYLISGIILFTIIILNPALWERAFNTALYARAPLASLVLEHILLVSLSSLGALIIGIPIGIIVTRPWGSAYLKPVNDLTALAQTFPPVAVLALIIPILGFGFKPTIVALVLFSILPIVRNTIAGLNAVAPAVKEAGFGIGMTNWQMLWQIELPLAARVITAGVRIAVVINVGTATIGAIVGAGGLGRPIIAGLVRDNSVFILEGALTAALLALIIDQLLALTEQTFFIRSLTHDQDVF
jgi:osmoprotectant transport system permease protein